LTLVGVEDEQFSWPLSSLKPMVVINDTENDTEDDGDLSDDDNPIPPVSIFK